MFEPFCILAYLQCSNVHFCAGLIGNNDKEKFKFKYVDNRIFLLVLLDI